MKPTKELFERMCFVTASSMPVEPKTVHLERGEVLGDMRRNGVPESVIYKHLAEGHGVVGADRIIENQTGKMTWNVSVRSGLFGDKIGTIQVEHQPEMDEAKDDEGQPIVREWANKTIAESIISSTLGENLRESTFDAHPLPLFILHLAETVGNKNAFQLYTELDKKLRQANWAVMMNEQRRWVIRPLREVTFSKPTNEQLMALGISSGQSIGVAGATGIKTEDDIPGVKELSKLFGGKADKVHEAIKKAKSGPDKATLMKDACVFLKAENVGHVKCEAGGVTYLEMSDPYDTTLIYDHAERAFRVGSWGEYVESRSSRFAHVLDESGELALDKTMCKSCMGLGTVADSEPCDKCGGVGRISVSESSPTTRIASEPQPSKRLPGAALRGHSTDTMLKVGASQDKALSEMAVQKFTAGSNVLDVRQAIEDLGYSINTFEILRSGGNTWDTVLPRLQEVIAKLDGKEDLDEMIKFVQDTTGEKSIQAIKPPDNQQILTHLGLDIKKLPRDDPQRDDKYTAAVYLYKLAFASAPLTQFPSKEKAATTDQHKERLTSQIGSYIQDVINAIDTARELSGAQKVQKNEALSVSPAKNAAVANTGTTPDDKNQVGLNKEGNTKPSGEAKDGPKTTGKPLSGDPAGKPGDGPSGDAPVVGKWLEDDVEGEPKTTGDKMLSPANPFGTEPKYTDDKMPQKGSQKVTEANEDGEPKTTGKPLVKDAEKNNDTNAGGGFKSLKKTPLEQVSTKLAEALVEGAGDSKKKRIASTCGIAMGRDDSIRDPEANEALVESISWTYRVPENKETRIYDLYLLLSFQQAMGNTRDLHNRDKDKPFIRHGQESDFGGLKSSVDNGLKVLVDQMSKDYPELKRLITQSMTDGRIKTIISDLMIDNKPNAFKKPDSVWHIAERSSIPDQIVKKLIYLTNLDKASTNRPSYTENSEAQEPIRDPEANEMAVQKFTAEDDLMDIVPSVRRLMYAITYENSEKDITWDTVLSAFQDAVAKISVKDLDAIRRVVKSIAGTQYAIRRDMPGKEGIRKRLRLDVIDLSPEDPRRNDKITSAVHLVNLITAKSKLADLANALANNKEHHKEKELAVSISSCLEDVRDAIDTAHELPESQKKGHQ